MTAKKTSKKSDLASKAGRSPALLDDVGDLSMVRLEEIEAELRSGGEIDARTRSELLDMLDWLAFQHREARLGRHTGIVVPFCARVVYELHKRHGVKVAAAVSAMVRNDVGTEESRRKLAQNIERAYSKIARSGDRISVSERVVSEALARINRK